VHLAIYAIFALTYLLIASRRLRALPIGRPAGALLGAVLMVAVGALTPDQAYQAVDHDTIVLLLGMMMMTAYLADAAFFDVLASKVLAWVRTPWQLMVAVSLVSGVLSALLVNDTVCLFMTPVVVALCTRAGLPLGPYLIVLATSANIGSAATLVGNPQNMIIGHASEIPFVEFLAHSGAAALAGLALNLGLAWLYYGRRLPAKLDEPAGGQEAHGSAQLAQVLAVVAAVVAGFFGGLHLGFTTLAGVVVLIVIRHRDPREVFARVDWPLLVFFCSLFVVVAGLASTGLVERVWAGAAPHMALDDPAGVALFTVVTTLGSNLVSNVPYVLLVGPHLADLGSEELGWLLLAFVSTVAGNLTLIGSVANIIVAEGARSQYSLGFREYLRFGLVSTALVLAAGVAVICATAD
jgi:Na+/H+ antiporter NhaD/arsenite permease-like protein